MNATITADVEVTGVVTQPKPRNRLRRVLALLALSAALPISSVVLAEPAHAASGVSYCFRHTNGGMYTYETYLQLWYNNQWNTMQNMGILGRSGCTSFGITGTWRNYPVRALAFKRVGNYIFTGVTPYYAPAGTGSYNLGTGSVNS